MPAQWTGDIFGKLKANHITQIEFARKLGYTPQYVCSVLSGKRSPKNAEILFKAALNELIAEKQPDRTIISVVD